MARQDSELYTPPAGPDLQPVSQARCKACQHPDRHAVDLALQSGKSVASTAKAFNLNELGLRNHKARHLYASPMTSAARLTRDADNLCTVAEQALADARTISDPVERSAAVSRATTAMRGALDLAARIRGELSNSSGTMAKTHLGMTLQEARGVLDRVKEAEGAKPEDVARQCVEYLQAYNTARPGAGYYVEREARRRERTPTPRAQEG